MHFLTWRDKPMRKPLFIFALLLTNIAAATATAADLTKIDRTIAKEPVYQNKPKYCLLVFGPEAKTCVWLVLDGNVLYVDRNGNGDLLEKGKRHTAIKHPDVMDWRIGDIRDPE